MAGVLTSWTCASGVLSHGCKMREKLNTSPHLLAIKVGVFAHMFLISLFLFIIPWTEYCTFKF
jgi:hypothetical protein